MNQPLAALANPDPRHTTAQLRHTQSEFGTISAHPAQLSLPPSFCADHRIVQSIVGQAFVAFYSCIAQRCVFVPTERENCLIHLLSVEYFESHEEVKVLHLQTGNG